ncbi:nucleotidyl transferase AbiEii/AbiGii toxin family protein [Treponema lecithinolyticum]|uniref:nucleotidyl transferase AbiEii/AbiGii toxin family protein n=1 Tax=Treponema lecithinolyticum TaxID=53418 RepID=UPI0028E9CD51|nr:nucleotidyl transferase AbiEii/AbiGii toxin family protein [Treponema lecithinolyticum]
MEKDIIRDYTQLYALQDKVLKIIFTEATPFYLTGETALHRFYCERRYSDDLDLFMQGQPYFYDEVKAVIYKLQKDFTVETAVNAKDFLRVKIKNLKIDFVNDCVYRYGKSTVQTASGARKRRV